MRRWVDPDLQKYRVFISDEKQWKPRARRGGMRAGPWDKVDPIANAVVGLVKASNATTAAIDAALEARTHGWTAYVSGW
jgi:hypothetical protein